MAYCIKSEHSPSIRFNFDVPLNKCLINSIRSHPGFMDPILEREEILVNFRRGFCCPGFYWFLCLNRDLDFKPNECTPFQWVQVIPIMRQRSWLEFYDLSNHVFKCNSHWLWIWVMGRMNMHVNESFSRLKRLISPRFSNLGLKMMALFLLEILPNLAFPLINPHHIVLFLHSFEPVKPNLTTSMASSRNSMCFGPILICRTRFQSY